MSLLNRVNILADLQYIPQALWNPHCDLNNSLAEYAKLYFGDAALKPGQSAASHKARITD
jgi:hypothetical protein